MEDMESNNGFIYGFLAVMVIAIIAAGTYFYVHTHQKEADGNEEEITENENFEYDSSQSSLGLWYLSNADVAAEENGAVVTRLAIKHIEEKSILVNLKIANTAVCYDVTINDAGNFNTNCDGKGMIRGTYETSGEKATIKIIESSVGGIDNGSSYVFQVFKGNIVMKVFQGDWYETAADVQKANANVLSIKSIEENVVHFDVTVDGEKFQDIDAYATNRLIEFQKDNTRATIHFIDVDKIQMTITSTDKNLKNSYIFTYKDEATIK